MRALFAFLALLGVAGIALGILTIVRGMSGPTGRPFSFENYGGPGPIIAGLIWRRACTFARSGSPGIELFSAVSPHDSESIMRPLTLVGILLLALGAFILFRGMTYKSKDEVLKVGDLKASVEEKHAVPTWAGGLAIVAGVVLIAGGMKKRA